jgi:hypothetical protein
MRYKTWKFRMNGASWGAKLLSGVYLVVDTVCTIVHTGTAIAPLRNPSETRDSTGVRIGAYWFDAESLAPSVTGLLGSDFYLFQIKEPVGPAQYIDRTV